jgi:hypothetical protein
MPFVYAPNNTPAQWPIAPTACHAFAPTNTGFPADCTGADLSDFSLFPLADGEQPTFDHATQRLVEQTPQRVGGVWTRQWSVVDLSPEEVAAAYLAAHPVPEVISDRQFAQALAMNGLITEAEALAWVKVGTVPAPLQALVDAIEDSQTRFAANMLLGGAIEFRRNHPLVQQLGAGLGITDAAKDDLWRLGATL